MFSYELIYLPLKILVSETMLLRLKIFENNVLFLF